MTTCKYDKKIYRISIDLVHRYSKRLKVFLSLNQPTPFFQSMGDFGDIACLHTLIDANVRTIVSLMDLLIVLLFLSLVR